MWMYNITPPFSLVVFLPFLPSILPPLFPSLSLSLSFSLSPFLSFSPLYLLLPLSSLSKAHNSLPECTRNYKRKNGPGDSKCHPDLNHCRKVRLLFSHQPRRHLQDHLPCLAKLSLRPGTATCCCWEHLASESEKAGSHRESNPGHLWLEVPVLCHWATTTGQLPALTILYMYCTGGTECFSHTPGSHSVCTASMCHTYSEGWWLSSSHGSVVMPEVSGFNSRRLLAFSLSSNFAS